MNATEAASAAKVVTSPEAGLRQIECHLTALTGHMNGDPEGRGRVIDNILNLVKKFGDARVEGAINDIRDYVSELIDGRQQEVVTSVLTRVFGPQIPTEDQPSSDSELA